MQVKIVCRSKTTNHLPPPFMGKALDANMDSSNLLLLLPKNESGEPYT